MVWPKVVQSMPARSARSAWFRPSFSETAATIANWRRVIEANGVRGEKSPGRLFCLVTPSNSASLSG
jgi:hypothetical protein